MTLESVAVPVETAGDDVVVDFTFPYKFFADDDLTVLIRIDSTGVETTQTITTDYTVAGAGVEKGGTVTMTTAPATGETLVILREEQLTQGLDLVENDPFPSNLVEKQLDIITMLVQQLQGQLDRALVAPKSDPSSLDMELPNFVDRGGKFLAFATGGAPIASSGPTGDSSIPVSAYIETLLDDADAATARETLGAGTMDDLSDDTTPSLSGPLDTDGNLVEFSEGVSIIAGSSCDIWANEDGNTVHITGNTEIDDFATAPRAGAYMWVIFDGTPNVVDSATITVDGNADATMAATDMALVYAETTTTFLFKIFRNAAETKELFISPMAIGAGGTPSANANVIIGVLGNTPFAALSANDNIWFSFKMPADFVSLTSLKAIMIPDAEETIGFDINSDFAAVGEDYDAGGVDTSNKTQAISAGEVGQYVSVTVTATLVGAAADDFVGIFINSDTTSLRWIGLVLTYTA